MHRAVVPPGAAPTATNLDPKRAPSRYAMAASHPSAGAVIVEESAAIENGTFDARLVPLAVAA